MNEEQALVCGIDEMRKANKRLKQILTPFYEIFDDDFKQTFRQFAECVSCLGLDCLTEEAILLSLSKSIRQQIDNESLQRQLQFDVDKIRRKLHQINDEKRSLDRFFNENVENKEKIFDEIRRKSSEKNFLNQKSRQYVVVLDDLRRNLHENRRFGDDVQLENVEKNKKLVEEMQKDFDRFNKRLSTYRNLPADEHLAKVKIEEKRLELEKLEKKLNDFVESFHFSNENETSNLL